MTKSLQFLSGGGEMGALTREYNWEASRIGSADTWPQSLRTTLSILLNSKFPMFLYWGPDLVCFYNDAYRFSLGNDGKHPSLLGMKGEEAWTETWHILKPPIDQVLANGEATWSEDQFVPIFREGEMKNAYWTFSFSPVKNENNLTAGVFLTIIETTEKVNNLKKLIETNDQLAFAIEATELGTFDLNPLTNKFIGNNRLKDWFGLPHEMEIDLSLAINVMVEKDRSRVAEAIQKTLQYESGGLYDTEYSIINPLTKKKRIVRAKGRAWFGDDKKAYRFNGTLQDITQQVIDRKIIESSINRTEVERKSLHDFFTQAPAILAILKGPDHVFEFANPAYLELIGNRNPIGKTVHDALPEVAEQGFIELLDHVYNTKETFTGKEMPIKLNKGNRKHELFFLNFTYQAITNDIGETEGILVFAYDVSEQVNARKQIEASEKRFSNILSQSLLAIAIFNGPEMVVDFANKPMLEVLGKGNAVLNKPLLEGVPELKDQVFPQLLANVYTTGVAFEGHEIKAILVRNGIPVDAYFNFVYQPYRDVDDTITGITVLATEVTEGVLANKQIEASELFNRTILESSPDCFKVLDAEGRIQFMNLNGLCQMEIDDFSTVKNKNWWNLWGSENELLVKASIGNALKGEITQFTAMCPTAKGTPKWWDVVVSPVGKPGEPVQQIISVSRDITEQQRSDEAIKKMAAHLKLATDSANVGIWSLDIKTQKLEWSALHKRMWGYDEHRSDLQYEDWHNLILPEDKQKAFKEMEEAKVNHTVYDVDYCINRANDGALRCIRSVGKYNYSDVNEAETLTGISIDITEQRAGEEMLKQSEKQFRVFADSIQNLAWISNGDGLIFWYNQRWYDYTGTTLEEMEGSGWKKVYHPDDIKKVIELLKEVWEKAEAFEVTCRLRRDDGEFRWFLTRAYPIKDVNGTIERWIGTSTDVHEQKKSLDQKDEFIRIASHEMKTPLTTAKGYLELLLMILSEENQTASLYANKANQAVERLNNFVTELIDTSKIQSGELDYNKSTFDFNEMVNETIEDIQFTAKNHSLKKIGISLYQIKGDRDRLRQVMINLLTNAIKYSPHEDKVLVKIEEQESNIQVSVQDFGVGMSSQHLKKVFDRYYRVEEYAIQFQGLGMGLYISNNIVRRHGGTMWVESEPGKGSTFCFTLPI